ncbi:hypothetical protein K501DRAFT_276506 [Backusella circina FSU 941]|nr:hypothetical protein K501DRAFT_276506 [Backusella circina FSU 941]
MSSHRSHINSWLKDLYQDDQIPLFDQTTENYESLLKLKQQHAGATLLVKSLITEKLSKKPDLQIKLENDNALQSLSLLAQLYGTGSTELSNYFTAITNASLQEMSLNDELRNLDDIEYTLDKWNQDATAELSTISGILAGLQNHQKNAQDHSQNSLEISEQLNNKTSEYVSLKDMVLASVKIQEMDAKLSSLLYFIRFILRAKFTQLPYCSLKIKQMEIKEINIFLDEKDSPCSIRYIKTGSILYYKLSSV